MNLNAQKLATCIAKGDKRLKKLEVPRTTLKDNSRGTVPSLRHALAYERVLKLKPRDWYTAPVRPVYAVADPLGVES
jgi:hypothetical protein